MTGPVIEIKANEAARSKAEISVSVLIPFYNDDPTPLVNALAETAPVGVEAILFDDGCPDAALNAQVSAAIAKVSLPVRLMTSKLNQGRSGARNRLAGAALGDWVLFLDADMRIDAAFLTRWIALTQNTSADVLFGGYEPVTDPGAHTVHAALAAASDDPSAARRSQVGAAAVCSSNLMVRRSAFAQVPFDDGYQGWGWEDVDWALSAEKVLALSHVDNPARHGGLESVPRLLEKFGQSGPNFARLLKRHPQYAARPGAKLALAIKTSKTGPLARVLGSMFARAPLPTRLRVLGLKLFRAGVAAKAIQP